MVLPQKKKIPTPRILSLAFVVFLLSLAAPSFSQPLRMTGGEGMGMRSWRGSSSCWRASELDLSPDQRKGLELLQQAFTEETQLPRAQLFTKRLELKEFLTDPGTKIELIRAKYLEINEIESKLDEKAIEYLIKVRNLLTQEQLKRWCPDQEIPVFRRMMHMPMGPMHR
jgi:Spy/CpxP family protein refolding chaperone